MTPEERVEELFEWIYDRPPGTLSLVGDGGWKKLEANVVELIEEFVEQEREVLRSLEWLLREGPSAIVDTSRDLTKEERKSVECVLRVLGKPKGVMCNDS